MEIDEKVGKQGEPPIAPASRVRRLRPTYNMRRFSAIGNKSVQKNCNHSIDTVATSGAAALRDFFVNCEHAVESKRTRGRPMGRQHFDDAPLLVLASFPKNWVRSTTAKSRNTARIRRNINILIMLCRE